MLERLAACATTGVGSLPFASPAEAAAHAATAYDVPFCPQLPRLDGDMVAEWLGPSCGWSPERDRERPHAWDAFLAEVTARPPAHGVVKLQVTGPLTLATALEAHDPAPAFAPAVVSLAREIAVWLAAAASAQVAALAGRGLGALLIVDEPAGASAAAAHVWDPLRAAAPAWGLHFCCPVPWDAVQAAAPDVLSLDVARYGADPRAAAQIERGGRIAWGLLPVQGREGTGFAAARLADAVAALGIEPARLFAHSLLTPACGTGLARPARERALARSLHAAAAAARALPVG
ncbi:uroporphyrinogen decarboxylase/cobalamine-independent methonine synthase family protein [Candidatus Solirubrobacter pratensis]|uniref:hypothetical protein n=1 Tax=Candidatus Solirubrobacter pratensis TaxID=1298857 RepID=UPI0004810D69|nr:hypothetical protein [Candidatus Solirubrobacter pratensis]